MKQLIQNFKFLKNFSIETHFKSFMSYVDELEEFNKGQNKKIEILNLKLSVLQGQIEHLEKVVMYKPSHYNKIKKQNDKHN
jgi:hypothetical protein